MVQRFGSFSVPKLLGFAALNRNLPPHASTVRGVEDAQRLA